MNLKAVVPSPIRPVMRSVLDRCAEAVDVLLPGSAESGPPARLNQSGAGDFKEVGLEFFAHFKDLGGLKPNHNVLDVGCGAGRMAVPLTKYLAGAAKYEGFDIMDAQIRWCQRRISSRYRNFTFHIADVYNHAYNRRGTCKASEYTFIYADGTFDFVFATSLFTHLVPEDMEQYLSEVSRVLKPGGRCLITAFLQTAESLRLIESKRSSFDFAAKAGGYYTIDPQVPERAIAYDETDVRKLYKKVGLEIEDPIHRGSWCGRAEFVSFQDIIVARKA